MKAKNERTLSWPHASMNRQRLALAGVAGSGEALLRCEPQVVNYGQTSSSSLAQSSDSSGSINEQAELEMTDEDEEGENGKLDLELMNEDGDEDMEREVSLAAPGQSEARSEMPEELTKAAESDKQQVAGKKCVRFGSKRYVETSLDDLSYSSDSSSSLNSSLSSTCNGEFEGVKASSQSADEEDERRLLARLQDEQRNKLRLAAEQQQQQQQQQQHQHHLAAVQQQQQQQQPAGPVCFLRLDERQHTARRPLQQHSDNILPDFHRFDHRATHKQPEEGDDEAEPEDEDDHDDEVPPEVPLRRSSQAVSGVTQGEGRKRHSLGLGARPSGAAPSARPTRGQRNQMQRAPPVPRLPGQKRANLSASKQQQLQADFFDPSQLPRPLLADDEWRPVPLPLPLGLAGKRPSQPPPAPPVIDGQLISGEQAMPRRRPPPPPPPPPPQRRRQEGQQPVRSRSQPPRNIWSPSTSSVLSSSSYDEGALAAPLPPLDANMAPGSPTDETSAGTGTGTGEQGSSGQQVDDVTVVERNRAHERHLLANEGDLAEGGEQDSSSLEGAPSAKSNQGLNDGTLNNGGDQMNGTMAAKGQQAAKAAVGQQERVVGSFVMSSHRASPVREAGAEISSLEEGEQRAGSERDAAIEAQCKQQPHSHSGPEGNYNDQPPHSELEAAAAAAARAINGSAQGDGYEWNKSSKSNVIGAEPENEPAAPSSNARRSLSVSLEQRQQQRHSSGGGKQREQTGSSTHQVEVDGTRSARTNARSYSIATSSVSAADLIQQQKRRQLLEQQVARGARESSAQLAQEPATEEELKRKYWTLPSNASAIHVPMESMEEKSKSLARRIGAGEQVSGKMRTTMTSIISKSSSVRQEEQRVYSSQQESGLGRAARGSSQRHQADGLEEEEEEDERQRAAAASIGLGEASGLITGGNVDDEEESDEFIRRRSSSGNNVAQRSSSNNNNNNTSNYCYATCEDPYGGAAVAAKHERHASVARRTCSGSEQTARSQQASDQQQQQRRRQMQQQQQRSADLHGAAIRENNNHDNEDENMQHTFTTSPILGDRNHETKQRHQSTSSGYANRQQGSRLLENDQHPHPHAADDGNQAGHHLAGKDEWFRQMYKQLHQSKQTPEKSLLQAVNSQPDTSLIRIKLKSPKTDHRYSPSYYSEEDFMRRADRGSISPAFKPGNICDYLPGQSSISQHERNLNLYYRLIEHIDRVFSSVLREADSRSTNTLQATSKGRKRQMAQSRSGPQTPVAARQFYREPLKGGEAEDGEPVAMPCSDDGYSPLRPSGSSSRAHQSGALSEHDRRCVFTNMLRGTNDEERQQQQAAARMELSETIEDPHKQYVAVQQGHDIPLKGLRKPAPQPVVYKEHQFSDDSINIHYRAPTSKLLKMNTFNEFELNRIRKLYNDELTSRILQRSKSSRLPDATAGGATGGATAAAARPGPLSAPAGGSHGGRSQILPLQWQTGSGGVPVPAPVVAGGAGVDLKRYEHAFLKPHTARPAGRRRGASVRFGRALFDFQAKSERELSLRRGDLLELLDEPLLDHTWARVEDCQSGLQGLVPINYIDYSVGCAVAKRDVAATGGPAGHRLPAAAAAPQTGPLLPMSKGEPITLIRRLSGHWYEASNTRQAMGLVWSQDLEIIKQPVLGDDELSRRLVARRQATATHRRGDLDADDEWQDEECDQEEEEEEEMLSILESGERVLQARRRARSAGSGPRLTHTVSSEGRQWRRRNYERAGQSQAPDLDTACTGPGCCCRNVLVYKDHAQCLSSAGQPRPSGHYDCGEGGMQMAANCEAPCACHSSGRPRRSSSSPYIASVAAAGGGGGTAAAASTSGTTGTSGRRAETSGAEPAVGAGRSLPRLCRARYAYLPRQKDELELVPGDILMVMHECDDGWFIGTSYASNQMGTFPGNFVEPV